MAVTGKEYSDMISDISLGMNSLHLFIPFCSVGTFAEICSVNRSVEIVGMTSTGRRIMQNGGLVISFNENSVRSNNSLCATRGRRGVVTCKNKRVGS